MPKQPGNRKARGRRAAHFFTFFDGGRYSAQVELPMFEAGVLPIQFYDTKKFIRPEAALYYAVLECAISEFQRGFVSDDRRAQRLRCEAEKWLFSDFDRWPFAFVNVCAVLDINVDYLRGGLRRWSERLLEKKQKGTLSSKDKIKIRGVVAVNTVTAESHLPRAAA